MQTLQLVPKQVSVNQSGFRFDVRNVTATDFTLAYQFLSDNGSLISSDSMQLPLSEIAVFLARPLDPVKINEAISSLNVQLINPQPLTANEKFALKQKDRVTRAAKLKETPAAAPANKSSL